jgi:glutamate synthase (NADPH/NADH) small chain
VCPAPCEASCTLNLIETPVTIKTIECAIVDRGWEEGWITPEPPSQKTGKKVSVIGSGPAGMACAQQLARAGHDVHLFEKHARAGGLLTYGIPDFKMEKHHVAKRVTQMEAEGVVFHYGAHVGVSMPVERVTDGFDAVVLTGGAEASRDLPIPGRELGGIHFAMDFLPQQNRRVAGEAPTDLPPISAARKHVVVIGGGDTGSDCIGTSIRQGALSVTNFEIMPKPPEKEDKLMTWPNWPLKLRTSSSHEEGAERDFAVMTQKFTGRHGRCRRSNACAATTSSSRSPAPEFSLKADLVLLAMGFVHPGARGHDQDARLGARRARQREGRHRDVSVVESEGLRGRRHAARPVARRVGDPRGPSGRACGRQVPDGLDRTCRGSRALLCRDAGRKTGSTFPGVAPYQRFPPNQPKKPP